MHKAMTKAVGQSSLEFFENNPVGVIITRFSKDLTILDMLLPVITSIVTQGIFRAISVVITVSSVNPIVIVFAVLGLIYMLKIVKLAIGPMVEA